MSYTGFQNRPEEELSVQVLASASVKRMDMTVLASVPRRSPWFTAMVRDLEWGAVVKGGSSSEHELEQLLS